MNEAINKDEHMRTAPDLDKIRALLIEKKNDLLEQIGEEESELHAAPGQNPDRGSLAHRYADRELNLALQDQASAQLAQVELALERLANENYGKCEHCGMMIAAARLEALPQAMLCVDCQSKADRSKHT